MTTQTTGRPTLVERETRTGVYDMTYDAAIIDHPRHGRLYIREGYGGQDRLEGGQYRWRQGIVCSVRPDDTLTSLAADEPGCYATVEEMIIHHTSAGRSMLLWDGAAIEALARAVGL